MRACAGTLGHEPDRLRPGQGAMEARARGRDHRGMGTLRVPSMLTRPSWKPMVNALREHERILTSTPRYRRAGDVDDPEVLEHPHRRVRLVGEQRIERA